MGSDRKRRGNSRSLSRERTRSRSRTRAEKFEPIKRQRRRTPSPAPRKSSHNTDRTRDDSRDRNRRTRDYVENRNPRTRGDSGNRNARTGDGSRDRNPRKREESGDQIRRTRDDSRGRDRTRDASEDKNRRSSNSRAEQSRCREDRDRNIRDRPHESRDHQLNRSRSVSPEIRKNTKAVSPDMRKGPRSERKEPFRNSGRRSTSRSRSREAMVNSKKHKALIGSKKFKPKDKKKRRRSSSSDSSSGSSDSSASSTKLMIRLVEERKKLLFASKEKKERMKALETPEEKRIRRLEKKDNKERKRKERMGWDNEYLHYTNTDNPFGDNNLLDNFVWKKKLVKEGLQDIGKDEYERISRLKQEESKRELEKVKKRRIERELERQAREEEEALLQRQKEAAQFEEWGNQEDLFHLEQATLRSKIRIKDGRAKPIDLLAQYISAEEEVNAIEMHEPYTYLNGLTVTDLEDLIEDIKVYKELEKGKNLSYWGDITVIVEDELRKLRKLELDDGYRVIVERREGINPAVADEVASIFKGKSSEQLQQLKSQIQAKLDGSSSGVDISYWESLLSQLKAHIARAQLRDRHQENLQKKLAMLKAEQGVEPEEESADENEPLPGSSKPNVDQKPDVGVDEASQESGGVAKSSAEEEDEELEDEEDEVENVLGEAIAKYAFGNFSPRLISQDDIEPGIFVIGEEEDNARLVLARTQVLNVGQRVENVSTAEELALLREAKKGMGNDEAIFSVESSVDQVYLWSDKYRPRKPRYFNRVHTGFEWNKYNQTHYDMDNPPPKIVQGYKFNIFYPDLIDKHTTPEYLLTTCADNPDFAILRFRAGPPYEDIAFKIVNREWEYSYKRGFRCQFHNNIFQLWFHFKRYRYRR